MQILDSVSKQLLAFCDFCGRSATHTFVGLGPTTLGEHRPGICADCANEVVQGAMKQAQEAAAAEKAMQDAAAAAAVRPAKVPPAKVSRPKKTIVKHKAA